MHDFTRAPGSFIGFLLMMIVIILKLACVSQTSCAPTVNVFQQKLTDGRGLPYKAFVGVVSTSLYRKGDCNDEKTCDIHQESVVASGTIVYRSVRNPTLAYVLTARHFCEHKDDVNEGMDKIDHRFVVYDFNGKEHRASRYFSVEKPMVDACVMMMEDMDDALEVAKIGSKQPEVGERVFNIAAPSGIFIKDGGLTFEGFFSGIQGPVALYTIPVAGGSSGSPVFNDRAEVVGMLWGYPLKNGHKIIDQLSFSIIFNDIIDIMNSIKSADFLIDYLNPTKTSTKT